MTSKPKIQYIGEFYTYGSAAQQVAPKTLPKKKADTGILPVQREEKVVYVDPVALAGIVVAVALVILMAFSTVQYVHATEAYEVMEDYVMDLRDVNIVLTHDYLTGIDWEYVRTTAAAIGLVPVAEADSMTLEVTVPQPEPERTFWDDVQWFLDGLLA